MRMPKLRKSNRRARPEPIAAEPRDEPRPGGASLGPAGAFADWASATFSGRTVAVSVDDDLIRVVVLKGELVTSWGSIGARPIEGMEDWSGADPHMDEASWSASQLTGLLSDLPQGTGRVVVALPHRSSMSRRLRIPGVKRKYREGLIASEIAETVPFHVEDIDISWADRRPPAPDGAQAGEAPETSGRRDVFAEASVKATVDEEIARLRSAGLRPRAGYSRATALASAVGLDGCLIVDMGERSASVVLVEDGAAVVVHQIEFGNGSGNHSPERVVATAVERVAAYHGPEADGDTLPPIVLTGMVDDDPELLLRVEASAGRRVIAFDPKLRYPGHFPASEYAVNLGLVLADRAREKGKKAGGAPRLSLLSERHLPPAFPVVKAVAVVALLALAYGAYAFADMTDDLAASVATLRAEEADLSRDARLHRLELAGVDTARRRAQEAAALAAAVDLAITDFDRHAEYLVDRALGAAVAAQDSGVRISTLLKEGESFKVSGSAPTFDSTSIFADRLIETGLYSSADLLSVEKGGGDVTFNLIAHFAPDEPQNTGPAGTPEAAATAR